MDALAAALDAFEGAVIIVSHNQRKCPDEVIDCVRLRSTYKVDLFSTICFLRDISNFLIPGNVNIIGFLCAFCNELWVVEKGRVDVRHSDTTGFEENFAVFRSETLSGAQGRSAARSTKTAMAKQATRQRTAPKTGGFIG